MSSKLQCSFFNFPARHCKFYTHPRLEFVVPSYYRWIKGSNLRPEKWKQYKYQTQKRVSRNSFSALDFTLLLLEIDNGREGVMYIISNLKWTDRTPAKTPANEGLTGHHWRTMHIHIFLILMLICFQWV
jgi:hypothetical protein